MMFKKPKRNFRVRRKSVDDEDDSENRTLQNKKLNENKEQNDTDVNKSTVISFSIEDEADTEEFKVKKSSQSRRMARKQKYEKKELDEKSGPNFLNDEVKLPDVNIEQGEPNRMPSPIEDNFDESDDEKAPTFTTRYRDVLSSGDIPDATFIHNIRKQRQIAREQSGFIPLENNNGNDEKNGRLIREDDNDISDNEERMKFHGEIDFELERREISNTIMAAEHESLDDDEDHSHDWEVQQIQKAVNVVPPQKRIIDDKINEYNNTTMYSSSENIVAEDVLGCRINSKKIENLKEISYDSIRKQIVDRLDSLQTIHSGHVQERNSIEERLRTANLNVNESLEVSPKLESDFKFYQEMRSYILDLVECLQEKMPKIVHLEETYLKLYTQKANKLCKRRQQDMSDEATENGPSKSVTTVDETLVRRQAEREGRRKRRKQMRERLNVTNHYDGMSTDEELTPIETTKFESDKNHIIIESSRIFEDVSEDFCEIRFICKMIEKWANEQSESYKEAYIALCLPKLFSPFIRLEFIDWNPLECDKSLESMKWFKNLVAFNIKDELNKDDASLIPTLIEKTILTRLVFFVKQVWDPTSSQQTNKLQKLVKKIFFYYPTCCKSSKQTQLLLKSIVKRIETTISEDVYIPLYQKSELANKLSLATLFFNRQFWSCIKLYSLIFGWYGIISDEVLRNLTFSGLLNKYIILGMTCSNVDETFFTRCEKIISPIPKKWFELNHMKTIPELDMMAKFLVNVAEQSDVSANVTESQARASREKIKQISEILVSIKSIDLALYLGNKFSFKVIL